MVSDQIMCIGKTAYMWNTVATPTGQQYRVSGQPIGIVRTVDSIDARNTYCNSASRTIQPNDVTSLIGTQVRVLDVTVGQPDSAAAEGSSLEAPLLKFVLTIGTRSEDGAVDPVQSGTYWTCPTGTFGTFCAVGTYSTTIYVQSGS